VTTLIQRMREELVRRNYAETTIRSYLQAIEDFRRFAPKRLDHLGPDEIRKCQVHLLEERKLGRVHANAERSEDQHRVFEA
jgi:integrase/recombinase XerD